MNIIWNQDPLATVIELDERDRKILRLSLEVEDLMGRIISAHMELDPGEREWIDGIWRRKHGRERTTDDAVTEALRDLTLDDDAMTKRLDEYTESHVTELANTHYGDCICQCCTCTKCRAEDLLGVDTIKGLGKHEANYVESAFKAAPTLDGAIEWLADHKPAVEKGWEGPYLERWTAEAKRAHEWLVRYRAEHFA